MKKSENDPSSCILLKFYIKPQLVLEALLLLLYLIYIKPQLI